MHPWALAILAPAMALVGVLIGVWIGHRHWKHEQQQLERTRFRNELRDAYLELWRVVEDARMQMRASLDGLSAETFSGYLADVNSFTISKGLFIDRRDRYLVMEYLFWTNEFMRQMSQAPEGRESLVMSLDYPEEFPERLHVLLEVKTRHQELREQLRQRIHDVVGAPVPARSLPDERPSERLLAQLDDLVSAVQKERETELSSSANAEETSPSTPELNPPPISI